MPDINSIPVHIHFGAHKTATTFLQNHLKDRSEAYRARYGCRYLPMWDVRQTLTTWLNEQRSTGLERFVDLIESDTRSHDLLLVSEENLAGSAGDLPRTGALYPDLERRAQKVVDAVGSTALTAFLSIRSYADFLPAMYCEYLRHNATISFGRYMHNVTSLASLSWYSVAQRLRRVFGKNVVLWKYEDLREHSASIVASLVGSDTPVEPLTSAKTTRKSPSAMAVKAALAIAKISDGTASKRLFPEFEKAFPQSDENSGFRPFSFLEYAELSERYERDVESLRRTFRFVV